MEEVDNRLLKSSSAAVHVLPANADCGLLDADHDVVRRPSHIKKKIFDTLILKGCNKRVRVISTIFHQSVRD